jgi:hypothetical protein
LGPPIDLLPTLHCCSNVKMLSGIAGQKVHSDCSECFNLYSSPDLGNWTFVDCVLKNEDIVAPQPGTPYYRMERPKILKVGPWDRPV